MQKTQARYWSPGPEKPSVPRLSSGSRSYQPHRTPQDATGSSSVTSTAARQAARLARVEAAGSDLERRGGARADRARAAPRPDRLAGVASREERRRAARPPSRPSRPARSGARLRGSASPPAPLGAGAKQPDSCVISTFRAPSSAMCRAPAMKSWSSWNSWPTRALRLALVRRDEERLGARAQPKRLAFGVEDRLDARAG